MPDVTLLCPPPWPYTHPHTQASELVNATAAAEAECAAAADSYDACLAAGVGRGPIDSDRFGDAPDIYTIEDVVSTATGARPPMGLAPVMLALALLLMAMATALRY